MVGSINTPLVAVATTPTVVSTFFAHLFARRKRKSRSKQSLATGGPGGAPEDELSYEEGLRVVRRFIDFASHHGVEEVQAFTAMRVPNSPWVRREVVRIPETTIQRAETILSKHLGSYGPDGENGGGLKLIGGDQWWRIRGRELEGEWIEMQKDYLTRTAVAPDHPSAASTSTLPGVPSQFNFLPKRAATMGSVRDNTGSEVIGERVILYIHGGAYFFSSLDTHRYQIQRHARKAGARAFSPAYRLAPQYPFPCGLLDSLAAYLYLIDPPPNTHAPILSTSIILMGDSAGAGMVTSLLVIIREMGLPMPAGASLISPWVDLTHSMPSIGGWDGGDFIPNTGFHYKPSATWPPAAGDGITVTLGDGTERHYDEQIQMYCPNNMLTHPLVSPVNFGSLGGLCPLLIVGGGAELLRDEIIYLAYKAANPTTYPPSSRTLQQYPDQAKLVDKYKPTQVHLQIYEGGCHVVPTLAITKLAKHMYRSCANFNIWAFTAAAKALERGVDHRHHHHHKHKHENSSRSSTGKSGISKPTIGISPMVPLDSAQPPMTASPAISRNQSFSDGIGHASTAPSTKASSASGSQVDLTKPIIGATAANLANEEEIDLEDMESEASSDSDCDSDRSDDIPHSGVVTVNGRQPHFTPGAHIVAERISLHGHIRPFEEISEIPALNPNLREHIGQVHGEGAIQKWLLKRGEWDKKYHSQLDKWRKIRVEDRLKAEKEGFLTRGLHGEKPPLCSLVSWYDKDMARAVGKSVDEISGKTSAPMLLWNKISQKPDKERAGGDNLAEIKANVEVELVNAERRRRASTASAMIRPGPGSGSGSE